MTRLRTLGGLSAANPGFIALSLKVKWQLYHSNLKPYGLVVRGERGDVAVWGKGGDRLGWRRRRRQEETEEIRHPRSDIHIHIRFRLLSRRCRFPSPSELHSSDAVETAALHISDTFVGESYGDTEQPCGHRGRALPPL